MTERVSRAMEQLVIGSLACYARECRGEGDLEQAQELQALAQRLASGEASEQDWLDAIAEVSIEG